MKVVLLNTEHLYGLAPGLRSGEITIKGNAADYTGMLNSGAKITIEGNVDDKISVKE